MLIILNVPLVILNRHQSVYSLIDVTEISEFGLFFYPSGSNLRHKTYFETALRSAWMPCSRCPM